MAKKITLGTLAIIFLFLFNYLYIHPSISKASENVTQQTIWKYQCIDTMKVSRDKARLWTNDKDLINHIAWEMQTIKAMGANCVAIDTPYDEEFYPYLLSWVNGAKKEKLHIWFRGNFSGWEEWFNYPKLRSTSLFLQNIHTFILRHKDIFEDGDIFTPAPEAEDGGPFNQVAPSAYSTYRSFLIDEYTVANQAFLQIHKQVIVNFLSMNGGFAKRLLNQNTVSSLGNIITIDHYVKSAPEMGQYIQYFAHSLQAHVVIGEFGAPIPDINGDMTEAEQAAFIDQIFKQLFLNKKNVIGINYWDLYDGSTALINPDQTPRAVVQVIKKYFIPLHIAGKVTDDLGNPLTNIPIYTTDRLAQTRTDSSGLYYLLLPNASTHIIVGNSDYQIQAQKIISTSIDTSNNINQKFILKPLHPSFFYSIQRLLKHFRTQWKI